MTEYLSATTVTTVNINPLPLGNREDGMFMTQGPLPHTHFFDPHTAMRINLTFILPPVLLTVT